MSMEGVPKPNQPNWYPQPALPPAPPPATSVRQAPPRAVHPNAVGAEQGIVPPSSAGEDLDRHYFSAMLAASSEPDTPPGEQFHTEPPDTPDTDPTAPNKPTLDAVGSLAVTHAAKRPAVETARAPIDAPEQPDNAPREANPMPLEATAQPSESGEGPAGQATLDNVRQLYRTNAIPSTGGATDGKWAAAKYGDVYAQVKQTLAAWRAQHPPEDTTADGVATKIMNTWIKLQGAGQGALLDTPEKVTQALLGYYSDATYATKTLGLKEGYAHALFNSRHELEAAVQEAKAADLSQSEIQGIARSRRTDIRSGIATATAALAAAQTALQNGAIPVPEAVKLTPAIVRHFAVNAEGPAACITRVQKYIADVQALTLRFKDTPYITPSAIARACQMTTDPEQLLVKNTQEVTRLLPEYLGEGGITEADIAHVVATSKNAAAKLDAYLKNKDAVAATLSAGYEGALDEDTIRRLMLHNSDPIAAGRRQLQYATEVRDALDALPNSKSLGKGHYAYLIRNYGPRAIEVGTKAADALAVIRPKFMQNPHITEDMLFKAALGGAQEATGKVIEMVDQQHQLARQYQNHKLPRAILRQAVISDDPQGHIIAFLEKRTPIIEQHGSTIPLWNINEICAMHSNPQAYINQKMSKTAKALAAYEHLIPVSNRAIVRQVLRSADPTEAVRQVYAQTIFDAMQQASKGDPRRGGPTTHSDRATAHAVARIRTVTRRWLADVLPETMRADAPARRLSRMYSSYIHDGGVPFSPTGEMMQAITELYGGYIKKLAEAGIPNADAVAQTNNPKRLLNALNLGADIKNNIMATARTNPTKDLLQEHGNYSTRYAELRAHFRDQGVPMPKVLLRYFARSHPNNYIRAAETHQEKVRMLPTQFQGNPIVDGRVIRHYSTHYYANPDQAVRDFLHRRETILAMAGGDPDIDTVAARELSLQNTTVHRLPDVIREYKQRLRLLRDAASQSGTQIDDDIIRGLASAKTSDVTGRLRRAVRYQQTRERSGKGAPP